MHVQFIFDVRTVALFIATAFFVQATAIGAQAFLIKDFQQYRGVGAALAANLCVTVGLLLRLFEERLPDFLSPILSNVLLLAGLGLFYIALSQFTQLTYSKAFVIGVIAAVLCVQSYFTYWNDDMAKRMISFSVGAIATACILVYQLWQAQQGSLRLSAYLMMASFLLYGTFLIVRTISILVDPPRDALSLTPFQSATYLLSFAISLFWSMGFIVMVSQRLRNDLMEIATVDVLTRIPNRRATQLFLEKELSRAQRNNNEFSVLLIDIDNFKQVNDRWGHAVGDHVLAKTAAIFQSLLRKQDWVGRWGGEEFLMILPSAAECDAESLGERLRSQIASSEYKNGRASFGITISVGFTCAKPSDQIDQILKNADKALYRAKSTKNAVSGVS